jgi:integrase/recombinase XerD
MVAIKHPKRALTDAELQAMREQCATKRDSAIFEFLRSTGCRAHEMLFTRIGDVDLTNKRVFFRKTKAKPKWKYIKGKRTYDGSEVVQRHSFFDDRATKAVGDYIAERRAEGAQEADSVFTIDQGGTKDAWMVWYIIKRLARDAKIMDWERISPHWLRHTAATRRMSKGVPTKYIKDELGWSQKSLTFETTYEHSDVDMMQKLHNKLMKDEEE